MNSFVCLSEEDYHLACRVGECRYQESRKHGLKPRGCKISIENDINGAAAELAFARAMEMKTSLRVNSFHAPDVGGYQIRSTPRPNGRLIVRPEDSDDETYVLLVGSGREWRIVGSALGSQAKQSRYWYDRNGRDGCYMVPQEYLRPVARE